MKRFACEVRINDTNSEILYDVTIYIQQNAGTWRPMIVR